MLRRSSNRLSARLKHLGLGLTDLPKNWVWQQWHQFHHPLATNMNFEYISRGTWKHKEYMEKFMNLEFILAAWSPQPKILDGKNVSQFLDNMKQKWSLWLVLFRSSKPEFFFQARQFVSWYQVDKSSQWSDLQFVWFVNSCQFAWLRDFFAEIVSSWQIS